MLCFNFWKKERCKKNREKCKRKKIPIIYESGNAPDFFCHAPAFCIVVG